MTRSGGRGGGAATALGVDFQSRVAAWFVCAILAETDASPLWEWPEASTLSTVYLETGSDVDDLTVTNSLGSTAFLQAKHALSLSSTASSPLGKALDQFARQHIARKPTADKADRLVLATSSQSSAPITQDLPRLLYRLRRLSSASPLVEAASNKTESRTLGVVVAHLTAAWLSTSGESPSEADLKDLLSHTWVTTFDLYEDEAGAQQSRGWLRSTTLTEPSTAGSVWLTLIANANELSLNQSGTGLAGVQAWLARLNVKIRPSLSYRPDIEKLKAYSAATLRRLNDYASIRTADGRVTIPRPSFDDLTTVARSESLLITGEPGVGKSAAVVAMAESLAHDDDVVVIAADSLMAGSLGLLRQELDLAHEFSDILANWPGDRKAHLVIDALDAARGEHTQSALIDLIKASLTDAPRWLIATTIRRFDLRYHRELRSLFTAASTTVPSQYRLDEFGTLHHFNIPEMSSNELSVLKDLAPALFDVIAAAPPELLVLIRNAFNLAILSDLVLSNVPQSELFAISTRDRLLEAYWAERVVGAVIGRDNREILLRQICELMIAASQLRVDRTGLQTSASDLGALPELLHAGVLQEDSSGSAIPGDSISFAHHVLFDYAVARLLFRGEVSRIVAATTENPGLILIVRPSYEYHFRHLWSQVANREAFWQTAYEFSAAPNVPEIAKIIAPGVASEEANQPEDLQPLLETLYHEGTSEVGLANLRYLIVARLTSGPFGHAVPEARIPLWAWLTRELALRIDANNAFLTRALLAELCDKPLAEEQASSTLLGEAARAYFAWVVNEKVEDRQWSGPAVKAIVRTFDTSAVDSDRLIRSLIQRPRLETHGYIEAFELSLQIRELIAIAPVLAQDIYEALFDFEEKSSDQTALNRGVLSLSSNRRQDYEASHYQLAEAFPDFMATAPLEALHALSTIWRLHIARRIHRTGEVLDIDWEGEPVQVETDFTYAWGEGQSGSDQEIDILNHFRQWLSDLVVPKDAERIQAALVMLRSEPRAASVWRRILDVAQTSAGLAAALWPLLSSREALGSRDLTHSIGDVLKVHFCAADEVKRAAVENAVLSLTDPVPDDTDVLAKRRQQDRDRLLGCLDPGCLVTDAARSVWTEISSNSSFPSNDDDRPQGLLDADWGELVEQGVDVGSAANQSLLDRLVAIDTFNQTHLNTAPSDGEVTSIYLPLKELWEDLVERSGKPESAALIDRAWAATSTASYHVSCNSTIDANSDAFSLARDILIASAQHALPLPNEDHASFDDLPTFSSVSPRVDAARGLIRVGYPSSEVDVLPLVETLASDPAPEVRIQIAQGISLLRSSATALMWTIAYKLLATETSKSVLAALTGQLPRLDWTGQPAGLSATLSTLYDAHAEESGEESLRGLIIEILAIEWIWRDDQYAHTFLSERIAALPVGAADVGHIVRVMRHPMRHGEDTAGDAAVRARTIRLVQDLYEQAGEAYGKQLQVLQASGETDRDGPQMVAVKATGTILNGIATEIYFASGAYDFTQAKEGAPTRADLDRFYAEAGELLEALTSAAIPSATHHVLETLETLIPSDPRAVFLLIAKAVRSGQNGHYEFDSMAADLMIRVMERYLAEQRPLLQSDLDCRDALIEILNVFVRAGWPAAWQLTYGLQDIFR